MSITYIIGDYGSSGPEEVYCSLITLVINPADLTSSWSRCGLTADFAGKYFSANRNGEAEVYRNIVSSVLNELIENAAKFSKKANSPVTIAVSAADESLFIEVENDVSKETSDRFAEYLEKLKKSDFRDLYFQKLESGGNTDSTTGIGLLMILKNYCSGLKVDLTRTDFNDGEETIRVKISLPVSLTLKS